MPFQRLEINKEKIQEQRHWKPELLLEFFCLLLFVLCAVILSFSLEIVQLFFLFPRASNDSCNQIQSFLYLFTWLSILSSATQMYQIVIAFDLRFLWKFDFGILHIEEGTKL